MGIQGVFTIQRECVEILAPGRLAGNGTGCVDCVPFSVQWHMGLNLETKMISGLICNVFNKISCCILLPDSVKIQ